MDKALNMSLDDLIKSKKGVHRGRGQGGTPQGHGARGSFGGGRMRGVGRGAGRQRPLGVNTRASSFNVSKQPFRRTKNFPLKHDLLEESLAAVGVPAIENRTKLYISNLDHGVSNDDIRELFSDVGELKRYAIHFNMTGRPSGSAEVVFAKRNDAFAAIKRYNNVQLDGRPMKIEIMNPKPEVPFSARVNVVGGSNGKTTRRVVTMRNGGHTMPSFLANCGISQRTRGELRNGQGRLQPQGRGPHSGQSRGPHSGQGRGPHSGQGRGGGRGRGKKKPVEKSVEELDNELEKYHAEGMQIS